MSNLEAAPLMVFDRVKRRYKRMMRAIMVKGKWAMENGKQENGKQENGKQACLIIGPVDFPLTNSEPIEQIEHVCKQIYSANLENKPFGNHARQNCGCMDTITPENNPFEQIYGCMHQT